MKDNNSLSKISWVWGDRKIKQRGLFDRNLVHLYRLYYDCFLSIFLISLIVFYYMSLYGSNKGTFIRHSIIPYEFSFSIHFVIGKVSCTNIFKTRFYNFCKFICKKNLYLLFDHYTKFYFEFCKKKLHL